MKSKQDHELIYEYIFTMQTLNWWGGNKAKTTKIDKIGEELIKRGLLTEEEHKRLKL